MKSQHVGRAVARFCLLSSACGVLSVAANAQSLMPRIEAIRAHEAAEQSLRPAQASPAKMSTAAELPSESTPNVAATAPPASINTTNFNSVNSRDPNSKSTNRDFGFGGVRLKPQWVAYAQIIPAPAPQQPAPQITSTAPESTTQNRQSRGRRMLRVFTDVQFGYDKQQFLVTTPTPSLVDVRRQVRNLVVTAQYPLSNRTKIAVSVPYVSQSVRGGGINQRGSGVGDIGVFVERRFPEVARGTEVSVTVGMLFPTGKDPYSVGASQLPTGLGFYQPLARVRISKMRVPLQFYGALDYGTSLPRNVGGERRRLPASYGAELGMYYSISPGFTAQTAVKWSRVSSPFTFENDSNVAYLSQGLIFTAGETTSFQAAVDAGLTEDALDFFLSLSLVKDF
jgi:hypothetical protein